MNKVLDSLVALIIGQAFIAVIRAVRVIRRRKITRTNVYAQRRFTKKFIREKFRQIWNCWSARWSIIAGWSLPTLHYAGGCSDFGNKE